MRKLIFAAVMLAAAAWNTVTAQTTERINIDGAAGKLAAVIHKPAEWKSGKCPAVIVCHGFGGNKESKLLVTLADTLQARGFVVVRFDFNGHGESDGDFVDMTVPKEIKERTL